MILLVGDLATFYSSLVVGSMLVEAVCVVVAASWLMDQQHVGHLAAAVAAVEVVVEADIWGHRVDVVHNVHIRVLALPQVIVAVTVDVDDSCLNLGLRVQWEVAKVALYWEKVRVQPVVADIEPHGRLEHATRLPKA